MHVSFSFVSRVSAIWVCKRPHQSDLDGLLITINEFAFDERSLLTFPVKDTLPSNAVS